MKEYIDKQELQQTMNRCENEWEQIPSWFNAQGIIELQPTITEAEIRAKAIDEFMYKVEKSLLEDEVKEGLIDKWTVGIVMACMDFVAEQMKEVE